MHDRTTLAGRRKDDANDPVHVYIPPKPSIRTPKSCITHTHYSSRTSTEPPSQYDARAHTLLARPRSPRRASHPCARAIAIPAHPTTTTTMQVNALFKKAAPAPAKTKSAPAKKSLFGAKKAPAAKPAPATTVKKTAAKPTTTVVKKPTPVVRKATTTTRKAAPSKASAKGDSKWYGAWVCVRERDAMAMRCAND